MENFLLLIIAISAIFLIAGLIGNIIGLFMNDPYEPEDFYPCGNSVDTDYLEK